MAFDFMQEDLSAEMVNHSLLDEELRQALGVAVILETSIEYGKLTNGSVALPDGVEFSAEQINVIQVTLRDHNPILPVLMDVATNSLRSQIEEVYDLDSLKIQMLAMLDVIDELKLKLGFNL